MDPLTGLQNRRAFDDRLNGAHPGRYAVLAIDLDNLKDINDAHGHEAGDHALRAAASVLSSAVRGQDLLARVGGDEFGVLLEGASIDEAVAVAERMRLSARAVSLPSGLLAMSVGCAAAGPTDSPRALWSAADAALYEAKRGGKDRIACASDSAMRTTRQGADKVVMHLLANRSVVSVYQPIVDLSTRAVAGYEALARPRGAPPARVSRRSSRLRTGSELTAIWTGSADARRSSVPAIFPTTRRSSSTSRFPRCSTRAWGRSDAAPPAVGATQPGTDCHRDHRARRRARHPAFPRSVERLSRRGVPVRARRRRTGPQHVRGARGLDAGVHQDLGELFEGWRAPRRTLRDARGGCLCPGHRRNGDRRGARDRRARRPRGRPRRHPRSGWALGRPAPASAWAAPVVPERSASS